MALGGFLTQGIGGGEPSLFPLLTGLDAARSTVVPGSGGGRLGLRANRRGHGRTTYEEVLPPKGRREPRYDRPQALPNEPQRHPLTPAPITVPIAVDVRLTVRRQLRPVAIAVRFTVKAELIVSHPGRWMLTRQGDTEEEQLMAMLL